MAYAKIEKSGCIEQHGNVHIRLAFYLEPGDARYNDHHVYVVDETCSEFKAGYQGNIKIIPEAELKAYMDEGAIVVSRGDGFYSIVEDGNKFDAWYNALPRIWRDNPFHNHFINGDPDITDAEITALAAFHLANFYEAWRLRKSIRSGWDVAHRIYPIRYEEFDSPGNYAIRKEQCQQRVDQIKALDFAVSPTGEGKTFPATAIDVGPTATDRALAKGDAGWTNVLVDNTANDTGSLDTFKFWFNENGEGVKAGTFFDNTPPDFENRDSEAIGNVTAGSEQTFSGKACDVTTGDRIGVIWTAGKLEWDNAGHGGNYYKSGDQFGAGNQTYGLDAGDALSVYATGETLGVTVTPTTLALTDAQYAPVFGLGYVPTTLALSDTQYAPVIGLKIIPPTLALTITAYEPSTELVVTPPTATLSLTGYAPTFGLIDCWAYRVPSVIDHSKVDADLSDFPVMIHLSASSGISSKDLTAIFDHLGSDANRKKVAITTNDGKTQCYGEIEKWGDAVEEAWLHVKAPAVSSSGDTTLHLYFDSRHADNDAYVGDTNDVVAENVWDSNFKAVYHMADGADNAHIYDSTSNDNDGTKKGANEPNQVAGQAGYAQDFDGDDDYIDVATSVNRLPAYTIEWVGNIDSGTRTLFSIDDGNAYNHYLVLSGTVYYVRVALVGGAGWVAVANMIEAGVTHHYAITRTYDSPTVTLQGYSDGVLVDDAVNEGGEYQYGASGTRMGAKHTGQTTWPSQQLYEGTKDEVRISDIARSASWIKATKESLWDNLITFGDVEYGTCPLVVPSTLALTDTLYAPTYGGGVVPPTLSLSDTEYAPVFGYGYIPATLALTDTQYAPVIKHGIIIPLETLGITIYTPVFGLGYVPSTLAISDTEYAPTIKHQINIPVLTLTLAKYAPDTILGTTLAAALSFIIEARNSSDELLAILQNAHNIGLTEELNRPPMLDFVIPADDDKLTHISQANQVWLRDYDSGTVLYKFVLSRRRDSRD